ncbi:MAG: hypothetical protein AAGC60_07820 [Acidobacteriota bacterium]
MSSLRRSRRVLPFALALVALLCSAGQAAAQDSMFTLGLYAGLGGAAEADAFGEASIQGLFSLNIAQRTDFEVRVGQLGVSASDETVEGDLTYVTFTTDYRLPADFYESGLFLGLGFYDFSSDSGFADDDALGLTLGVLGDFRLVEQWSLLVELSGHYADLDQTQFFLMAHVGVGFHF